MGCRGEIPRHLVLDTRCFSLRSRLSSYFEFRISISRLPQMFQSSIIMDPLFDERLPPRRGANEHEDRITEWTRNLVRDACGLCLN